MPALMRKLIEGISQVYRTWLLCLLALAGCGFASAQEQRDPLAAFYSNTLNAYSAQGVNHYYVNADHSWSGKTHDGRSPSGTWRIEGKTVCFLSQSHPEECFHFLGRKLGETWVMSEEAADEGEVVAILHKGRG